MLGSPPRRDHVGAFIELDIDPSRRGTIRMQLLTQIRASIVARRLAPGSRLPSTRTVAERFGISRNTVTEAFDQLLAEGYLVARHGSGTYVSPAVRDSTLAGRSRRVSSWKHVSRRGKLFAEMTGSTRLIYKEARAFQPGIPAVDLFPFATWSRIAGRLLRHPSRELVSYGEAAGYRALREAIAAHLRTHKHINCVGEDIIVTSGTQQALDIISRLMLDPDSSIWLEDPGSLAARAAFATAGVKIVPVPVDGDGMIVSAGIKTAPFARLAHVTASNQHPTSVALSESRSCQLVSWAHNADAWIVEDDYNGEFRYDGKPARYVRSDACSDRVIFVGSFSITTFPALRIGYIVAPDELVDAFTAAKGAIDRQSPTLEQAILAEFMVDGHYDRHLKTMADVYAERRDALERCMSDYLPQYVYRSPDAGLHGTLLLDCCNDGAVAAAAARRDISVFPLSSLHIGRPRRNGLLLGFGVASPGEIRLGVRKLRDAIAEVDPGALEA